MKKVRDLVGVILIAAGVGGLMAGVRGASGDAWWGGPAIGAGVVANVLAYSVMRPSAGRGEEQGSRKDDEHG